MRGYSFCKCWDVRSKSGAVKDIIDEMKELVKVRSFIDFKDEASDVIWGFGRLLGSVFGVEYIGLKGDGIHYRKVVARFEEQGCIRSKRLLVDGKCANS